MVVTKPLFIARISIEKIPCKYVEQVKSYMKRNGWEVYEETDGWCCHFSCKKEFVDIELMQKEIQDVNDAFNYSV